MKPDFTKILSASTVFAFLCACLYLTGYWTWFGINPYEFITLTELTLRAILPLTIAIPAALLYAVVVHRAMEKISGQEENADTLRRKRRKLNIMAVGMAILATMWMFVNPIPVFFVVPVTIGVLLALYCVQLKQVRVAIKNAALRSTIVFLIIMPPMASLGMGLQSADYIVSGIGYKYVEGKHIRDAPDNVKREARLPFLGKMGEYGFFLLPERKSIWVAKLDALGSFELIRSERRFTFVQMMIGEWAGPSR